jgi:hypothetical protein
MARRVGVGIVALVVVALGGARAARATDTWSDPFPGVKRLHRVTGNQDINVLVVDLCAPGVGVRATAAGEKGRTVGSFGALVGAQAAVNGDFYASGYATNGPAMHAGAGWGGEDHGYVAPVQFGARRVAMAPHEDQGGVAPWALEVVSGHPTILSGGAPRDNNGDPLCTNRHPRTAIGFSADKRTMVLVVVYGRAANRIGMTCDELGALFVELGASDALNLDGGGSSTMWLAGAGVVNHPSDGQQRVVANHLGVYASGGGDAPFCPNRRPRGWLDAATCEAGVSGWAQDEDAPEAAIDVHVYFGGPAGAAGAVGVPVRAATEREDLCGAIGSCAHGWRARVPGAFLDGAPHEVWAYGIDAAGGDSGVLAGAPAMIQCAPPAPPADGVRRHVTSPEALAAWGFAFHDVITLPDEEVGGLAEGAAWPEAPRLVRVDGAPEVWVVDGTRRRHVPSPAAMEAWHLDWGAIEVVDAATLASWAAGPALPEAPYLLRGGGAAVWIVDAAEPAGPGGGGGGDDGGGGEAEVGGGCGVARGAASSALVWLVALAIALARWGRRGRR